MAKNKTVKFTADFECCSTDKKARVWLWCLMDEKLRRLIGTDIDSFMKDTVLQFDCNVQIYFHVAEYDCSFILDWLLRHNYKQVFNASYLMQETFYTLVSSSGSIYSLQFKTFNGTVVTIYDSYKKIRLSVADIATSFNLPQTKGIINYDIWRDEDYIPTQNEIDYITDDCEIVMQALKVYWSKSLNKSTIGADAMKDYKATITAKQREEWFPSLDSESYVEDYKRVNEDIQVKSYGDFVRQAYHGGVCVISDKFKNKNTGPGIAIDRNSMYPAIARQELLPYGKPVYHKGVYEYSEEYPLAVVHIIIRALGLKPKHLPCISGVSEKRHHNILLEDTYQENCENGDFSSSDIEIFVTNIELELIKETYDFVDIEYIDYLKFKAQRGMFDTYIDKWYSIKQSSKGTNPGLYTLSKLMLNNLIGKFAWKPKSNTRAIDIDVISNKVTYDVVDIFTSGRTNYIPIPTFINAYARIEIIKHINANYDRFIYSDTDSVYLTGTDIPTDFNIGTELGQYSLDKVFDDAKFIKPKTYITVKDSICSLTVAGIPKYIIRNHIRYTRDDYWNNILHYTLSDFKLGMTLLGIAHSSMLVSGGIHIFNTNYTLGIG